MLSLFLYISASINTEWPIERHECGAWIGEYDYDLSGLQTRAYEQIEATINYHHLRFVIKVCNGFSSLEIPHDFDDMFMYSFAVCDEDNEVCYPLASKYSTTPCIFETNTNADSPLPTFLESSPIANIYNRSSRKSYVPKE